MLSFEMRGLMDPYKLKPNFEYKKGINKVNDGLMNPEKKLKKVVNGIKSLKEEQ